MKFIPLRGISRRLSILGESSRSLASAPATDPKKDEGLLSSSSHSSSSNPGRRSQRKVRFNNRVQVRVSMEERPPLQDIWYTESQTSESRETCQEIARGVAELADPSNKVFLYHGLVVNLFEACCDRSPSLTSAISCKMERMLVSMNNSEKWILCVGLELKAVQKYRSSIRQLRRHILQNIKQLQSAKHETKDAKSDKIRAMCEEASAPYRNFALYMARAHAA